MEHAEINCFSLYPCSYWPSYNAVKCRSLYRELASNAAPLVCKFIDQDSVLQYLVPGGLYQPQRRNQGLPAQKKKLDLFLVWVEHQMENWDGGGGVYFAWRLALFYSVEAL